MSPADSVQHLLESVARLPDRDQYLLLELVNLMMRATPEVQAQARTKLRALLAAQPRSHNACVADVGEVVAFLRTRIAAEDPEWVAPLWRESILSTPD